MPRSGSVARTKQKATELCRKCHKRTVDLALHQDRVHWPLLDDVGCLNCHGPHATKDKNLLNDSVHNVCGKCHQDTVHLQEWSIKNNERLCEPVKTGNCIACHSPHAGNKVLLFNQESVNNGLCGRCHKWESHSTHPIGERVVDQRDRNLTLDCLSCHKGCGTGNNKSMLTFSTTYELCIQCHVERRK
jgi:predicted CXXCH cytochrome family protein